MIFNTWLYGIFLLATFCLYWLAPERDRPWLLIVFGCYFYWAGHAMALVAAWSYAPLFPVGWVRPCGIGRGGNVYCELASLRPLVVYNRPRTRPVSLRRFAVKWPGTPCSRRC